MLIAAPGQSAELPALVRGQPGCGARNRDSALPGAARSASCRPEAGRRRPDNASPAVVDMRAPLAPRPRIHDGVCAGQNDTRQRSPEPCVQVRILLGALKSNTQANHASLAICHLTWAYARHRPPLPRRPRPRHAPGPGTPDSS
jgi:hypothetical protein